MYIRMRSLRRLPDKRYRLTVAVIDPDRDHWDDGDCQLQADLWDEPSHRAQPRGPLIPAFELFELSPDDRPAGGEAALLWDIGRVMHEFIDNIFAGYLLCPFRAGVPADTEDRPGERG